MVHLEIVQETNRTTFNSGAFVAVFVGATSGIGGYTVLELAKQFLTHPQDLRVYIIGRNASSGDKVIAECSIVCPGGQFFFVQCEDIALLNEVDRVCRAIDSSEKERHASGDSRIDLLFMTQGKLIFGERSDTAEGIDRTMSLVYYSRMRFITNLMPLLQQAGATAHVISVYAAGLEANLLPDDLSLQEPGHYSFSNARSHAIHMTTMAFERLSKNHPSLSFVHVFPGVVITPAYADPTLPFWFRAAWAILGPLVRVTRAISPEESGQRMLYLLNADFCSCGAHTTSLDRSGRETDGLYGSGCYAVDAKSEVVDTRDKYEQLRKAGFEHLVWQHTQKVFRDAVHSAEAM